MPLTSMEPSGLYRQIAKQLCALIVSGEYAPGTRLPPERDLAKQLGVSRPSVREALIALKVETYVDIRTGSGIYARRPDAIDVNAALLEDDGPLELTRARAVIEPQIAALAAKNITAAQIEGVRAAIEQMETETAAGHIPIKGDRRFTAGWPGAKRRPAAVTIFHENPSP